MAGPGEAVARPRSYGARMEPAVRRHIAEAAALARIHERGGAMTRQLPTPETRAELRAEARAMWGLGDYDRFARRARVGLRAGARGCVRDRGPAARARRRRGLGQRRAARGGGGRPRRGVRPHTGESRRGSRSEEAAGSSSNGSRRTPRRCRSATASSTSSPRRSARCSRPTTRRWPTSCSASAVPAARSGWSTTRPRAASASSSSSSSATCRRRRPACCRRCSGATRSTSVSSSATASRRSS